MTYPATDLDITDCEENCGRRNFLDDESADGVTLTQGQNFVRGFDPDPCGASVGVGMPGGA